jgi:hypothetical protein
VQPRTRRNKNENGAARTLSQGAPAAAASAFCVPGPNPLLNALFSLLSPLLSPFYNHLPLCLAARLQKCAPRGLGCFLARACVWRSVGPTGLLGRGLLLLLLAIALSSGKKILAMMMALALFLGRAGDLVLPPPRGCRRAHTTPVLRLIIHPKHAAVREFSITQTLIRI